MSERLDKELVKRRLVESREKGKKAISDGHVLVDGKIITVSKFIVDNTSTIEVLYQEHYVSRAAGKLLGAIEAFQINLSDKSCLDIGASTGGFTQVCLEAGAERVIALDVGYDQLHPKIRENDAVYVMEKYNFRYASEGDFPWLSDFFCSDVSFISLQLIIPSIACCVSEEAEGVLLIKPQFEAGSAHLDKHGVVKDLRVHQRVIEELMLFLKNQGFGVLNLAKASVIGKSGNQEYVIYVKRGAISKAIDVASVIYK